MADQAGGTTLRSLLTLLGPTPLRLLNGDKHLDRRVDAVLLLDAHDSVTPSAHSLALAVGAGAEEIDGVLSRAVATEAAGVVIKSYGADPAPLGEAVADRSVAVFCADDEFQWQQLLDLASSALQSLRGEGGVGDLFALANTIAASVGGAVSIEDTRQRVLAYSNIEGQVIDEARTQGILNRQVPNLPRHAEAYRQLALAPGAYHAPDASDRLGRVAVAIKAGGEMLGSIWVVDAGRLHPDTDQLLEAAATTAAFHLLRARASTDSRRVAAAETLRALLDGRTTAEIASHRLDFGLHVPCSVCVLDLTVTADEFPEDVMADRVADLLEFQLRARRRRCIAAAIGSSVYALVAAGPKGDQKVLAEVVTNVIDRVRNTLNSDAVAGLGPVVDGLAHVADSRREAESALLGVRLHRDRRVGTLAEVREHVILLELQRQLSDNPSLQLPEIEQMLESDRDNGTAYGGTVLNYLETFGDINWAASRMQVHPNTFRYRLKRAQETFALNLDRPEVRLIVWLQLRARVGHT